MARGDHDAVGASRIAGCKVGIVIDDRDRYGRGWRVSASCVGKCHDAVAGQYLEAGDFGRSAKCVGVFANINRAANANRGAVFNNRLGNRRDVVFVERCGEGCAAVTAGAEHNLLLRVAHIWVNVGVGGQQLLDVD